MTIERVSLIKIEKDDLNILENLMELYLHDLSAFSEELKINEKGKFGYEGLQFYLSEEDLGAFFIYADEELCGFALLNSGKYVPIGVDYSIHEFFIAKYFRKKGVGKRATKLIFENYPGRYKIEQLSRNIRAIEFWRNVYKEYDIEYNEMTETSDGEEFFIQILKI